MKKRKVKFELGSYYVENGSMVITLWAGRREITLGILPKSSPKKERVLVEQFLYEQASWEASR